MSEFGERGEQAYNPWKLGDDLLVSALKVKRFIEHRDPTSLSTIEKINSSVVFRLVQEHKDKELFVKSANAMIPLEDGYGVGLYEGKVKLVGFAYGEYFIADFSGQVVRGLIMLVSQNSMNGQLAENTPNRLGLLPLELQQSIDGIVTAIPIVEGVQIAELDKSFEVPDSLEKIETNFAPSEFNYSEFVASINAITGKMAIGNIRVDSARIESATQMLQAMNMQCPFLGKTVVIESGNLRFPNPIKGNYKLAIGAVEGILRKFVIDLYQDQNSGEFKSDVQAVVYRPEVAERVYKNSLTPQEADKLDSTCYIPLSITHTLTVK